MSRNVYICDLLKSWFIESRYPTPFVILRALYSSLIIGSVFKYISGSANRKLRWRRGAQNNLYSASAMIELISHSQRPSVFESEPLQ